MNVFAFASRTETQGLVLAEAMAAGVAVVAIDAPGAREIVQDGINGRLLDGADEAAFHAALDWVIHRDEDAARALGAVARAGARDFSLDAVAERALSAYGEVIVEAAKRPAPRLARPAMAWPFPLKEPGEARQSARWRPGSRS